MIKKRMLALILAAFMVISTVSCGMDVTEDVTEAESTEESTTEEGTEVMSEGNYINVETLAGVTFPVRMKDLNNRYIYDPTLLNSDQNAIDYMDTYQYPGGNAFYKYLSPFTYGRRHKVDEKEFYTGRYDEPYMEYPFDKGNKRGYKGVTYKRYDIDSPESLNLQSAMYVTDKEYLFYKMGSFYYSVLTSYITPQSLYYKKDSPSGFAAMLGILELPFMDSITTFDEYYVDETDGMLKVYFPAEIDLEYGDSLRGVVIGMETAEGQSIYVMGCDDFNKDSIDYVVSQFNPNDNRSAGKLFEEMETYYPDKEEVTYELGGKLFTVELPVYLNTTHVNENIYVEERIRAEDELKNEGQDMVFCMNEYLGIGYSYANFLRAPGLSNEEMIAELYFHDGEFDSTFTHLEDLKDKEGREWHIYRTNPKIELPSIDEDIYGSFGGLGRNTIAFTGGGNYLHLFTIYEDINKGYNDEVINLMKEAISSVSIENDESGRYTTWLPRFKATEEEVEETTPTDAGVVDISNIFGKSEKTTEETTEEEE